MPKTWLQNGDFGFPMQTPKLFEVLERLNAGQLRRFQAFVDSPYFNTRSDVRAFIQKILEHWKPGQPVPDRMAMLAYGVEEDGQAMATEKQLGYLLSWSLSLVERFLVQEDREGQPWDEAIRLMRLYDQWAMDKHYRSAEKTASREAVKYPFESPHRHWLGYRQASVQDQHFNRRRKHEKDDSLGNAVRALDLFYLTERLRLSCELANRRDWVSGNSESGLLEELLAYLERSNHEDLPMVAMFHHTLLSITTPDHARHFERLRDLLGRHGSKLETRYQRDLYGYAINYCIKRVNTGDSGYLVELFELYRGALEEGILEEDGQLSPWSFKNIVSVACRSGNGAWAENFLQTYRSHLAPALRANAVAYNQGYIHWHFGRYADALQKLQEVSMEDLYYALDSRSILIKCYYELDEVQALEAALEAFRVYLQRNRHMAEGLKKTYSNFVAAVRALARSREGDRSSLERLEARMAADPQMADRAWVQEKLEAKSRKGAP